MIASSETWLAEGSRDISEFNLVHHVGETSSGGGVSLFIHADYELK